MLILAALAVSATTYAAPYVFNDPENTSFVTRNSPYTSKYDTRAFGNYGPSGNRIGELDDFRAPQLAEEMSQRAVRESRDQREVYDFWRPSEDEVNDAKKKEKETMKQARKNKEADMKRKKEYEEENKRLDIAERDARRSTRLQAKYDRERYDYKEDKMDARVEDELNKKEEESEKNWQAENKKVDEKLRYMEVKERERRIQLEKDESKRRVQLRKDESKRREEERKYKERLREDERKHEEERREEERKYDRNY